uniref:(northern house mosquito) hypothetical protein n=1 Tax=Culex pipiens TaxID=7175 RepID=A0A8D8CLN4_CULPI
MSNRFVHHPKGYSNLGRQGQGHDYQVQGKVFRLGGEELLHPSAGTETRRSEHRSVGVGVRRPEVVPNAGIGPSKVTRSAGEENHESTGRGHPLADQPRKIPPRLS